MTFNEFQRELSEHGVGRREAYFLTVLFERLVECEHQLTLCARLIDGMANSMKGFVELSEAQQRDLRMALRGRMPDGISVESVVNEPEED